MDDILVELFIKTNAIVHFPLLQNIVKVRKFLGLSGYFRKFVAGYFIFFKPLRKKAEFTWGHHQQSAFNESKNVLSSKPTMVNYRNYRIVAEHEYGRKLYCSTTRRLH